MSAPKLLFSLDEQHTDTVNDAIFVPEHDAIISVSEDKTLLIWLKRDTGAFWPSVSKSLPSAGSVLSYSTNRRELFVGIEQGAFMQYRISEDYNSLDLVTTFPAHQGRVTSITVDYEREIILSCARDRYVRMHNLSGRLLAAHCIDAWCSCLEYDKETGTVFLADYKGEIHVIQIEDSKFKLLSVLKSHTGSIRCLRWIPSSKFLFSGSFDTTVICWDVGGRKGLYYELRGHNDKVKSMVYLEHSRELLTSSDDGFLVAWDLNAERQPTPEWAQSDICQLCSNPFLWNVKEMWETRNFVIKRQHHCRRCGKAVCDSCSKHQLPLPVMGYEFPVRMCKECFPALTDDDRHTRCKRYPSQQPVVQMRVLDYAGDIFLLTCGSDKTIKMFTIKDMLAGTASATESAVTTAARSDPRVAAFEGPKVTAKPQVYSTTGFEEERTGADFASSILGGEDDTTFSPFSN